MSALGLRGAEPGSIQHRFIAADSSQHRIALIDEGGETEWEFQIGPLHDLHFLPSGNVLFQTSWTKLIEVDPRTGKTVWTHDVAADRAGGSGRIEVHAFQRLSDGGTMIAASGARRIIELAGTGEVARTILLRVAHPHPHHDTRLVRKLPSGNYLVCHEADGVVREYRGDGSVAWEFRVPMFGRPAVAGHGPEAFGNQCFAALRLGNGNTLITTGNGHSVLEVQPDGDIVWQLEQDELPGIQLAWVTTLQVLDSGNIVIGNCHAGPENPQIIEITREKQVVWTWRDFDRFGNALTNSQILTTDGRQEHPQSGVDR
ncbi:MAG: hypothetical protein D6753_01295 [Planctomycetota bacterium]|nr:MAG: hypothetical protein D6753_01295 [Planctomycetota bacterium]